MLCYTWLNPGQSPVAHGTLRREQAPRKEKPSLVHLGGQARLFR